MSMSFQILDVLVAAVLVASTVYAAYRGFANETLSILAWLAAALATLFFGPWVASILKNSVSPMWMGEISGYLLVFLSVFIPLSFMSFRLSQNVKKSQVGPLDRALGAVFGIVRGLAILGILYLIFAAIVPLSMRPAWVTNAYSLPLVKVSAEALASLVPDSLEADTSWSRQAPENTVTKAAPEPPAPAAEPAPVEKPHHAQKHRKKTYSAKDREALDRLIETNQDRNNGKP